MTFLPYKTPPRRNRDGVNVVERDNTKKQVRNEEYTARHR